MLLIILITILIIIITSLFFYARWNFGILESLNIKVVERLHFILGTTFDSHLVNNGLRDIEWMCKYGPIFGVYEGRQPQIYICDAEIIRRILVKDYQHFNRRRDIDFGSPLLNEQLDFMPAEKWKILRKSLSPHMSSGIKKMNLLINECMEDFVRNLNLKIEESNILVNYDIRKEAFNLVTDMILRCVFSIKAEGDGNNNHFINILNKLLSTGNEEASASAPTDGPYYSNSALALSFPFLKKIFGKPLFNQKAAEDFIRTFKDIIKKRQSSSIKQADFTQSIIELLQKLNTPEFKNNNITEMTLMCQVLVFFFAGQDPISGIITILTYYIAKNPTIEEKLVVELDEFFSANNAVEDCGSKVEHDRLQELTYLNSCINEALRLYPFFIRIERVCTQDWEMDLEEDEDIPITTLKITKGLTVMIPTWAANRNPKYFEEPNEFNPERFQPNYNPKRELLKSPYAFTSFGHGPRNCIGQRFSMEALLVGLAQIFYNFQFRLVNDKTELEFENGSLMAGVVKPIYLKVQKRNRETKA